MAPGRAIYWRRRACHPAPALRALLDPGAAAAPPRPPWPAAPEPILAKYGADAVRWFMLSDSPPERDLEWSEAGIEGASRFVQRVWRLVNGAGGEGEDQALERKVHRTIAAVGEAIEGLQFN